jgi:hypothetical protein
MPEKDSRGAGAISSRADMAYRFFDDEPMLTFPEMDAAKIALYGMSLN